MADQRQFELDELLNRPGTYFNPQTEVMLVLPPAHLMAYPREGSAAWQRYAACKAEIRQARLLVQPVQDVERDFFQTELQAGGDVALAIGQR